MFAKFTGKHLCLSLFFNKVAGLINRNSSKGVRPEACNFFKKETLAQVFPGEFCEIFKELFCMRWNTSRRWDVSPEWGTFHPAFRGEKYPTWVRYTCMPIFKQRRYFYSLLIFCFYFKFELLVNIYTAKF